MAEAKQLEELLSDRQQISARIRRIAARDNAEFEKYYKIRNKTDSNPELKSRVAGTKFNCPELGVSSPIKLFSTTFYGYRQANHDFNWDAIKDKTGLVPFQVYRHFVDFCPINELISREIDARTAIVIDSMGLFMSPTAEKAKVQAQYQALLKKNESCGNAIVTLADSAVMFDFIKRLYNRFYAQWQKPGKDEHAESDQYLNLAADAVYSYFANREVARLATLASTKEEVKALLVVDSYVSAARCDRVRNDLLRFVENPLPLFAVAQSQAAFNIWAHLKEMEKARTAEAEALAKDCATLAEYSQLRITHTRDIPRIDEACARAALLIPRLSDFGRNEDIAAVFELKNKFAAEKTEFQKRVKETEELYRKNNQEAVCAEAELKKHNAKMEYTIGEIRIIHAASKRIASLPAPQFEISEDSVVALRRTLEETISRTNSAVAAVKSRYDAQTTTLTTAVSKEFAQDKWKTHQAMDALDKLSQQIEAACEGRTLLGLPIGELQKLRERTTALREGYVTITRDRQEKLDEISTRHKQLQKELDCRMDPKTGFNLMGDENRKVYCYSELMDALGSKGGNDLYAHHVVRKAKRNDFAKWIRETLRDKELADRVDDAADLKTIIGLLKYRIDTLKAERYYDVIYATRITQIRKKASEDVTELQPLREDNALDNLVRAADESIRTTAAKCDKAVNEIVVSAEIVTGMAAKFADPKERQYTQDLAKLEEGKRRCEEILLVYAAAGYVSTTSAVKEIIARITTICASIKTTAAKNSATLDAVALRLESLRADTDKAISGKQEAAALVTNLKTYWTEARQSYGVLDTAWEKDDSMSKRFGDARTTWKYIATKTSDRIAEVARLLNVNLQSTLDSLAKLNPAAATAESVQSYLALKADANSKRPLYDALVAARGVEAQNGK